MSHETENKTDRTNSSDANIVIFSFIGDALALGPHLVYDQEKIRAAFGRVTSYHAPITNYHPGKSAGDFTHYGDQVLILLRTLAGNNGFDLKRFAIRWLAFWEEPANIVYRDGATRQTLEHLESGLSPECAGSDSHDIGGAGRIGPLFLLNWESEDAMLEAMRLETAFTHATEEVIESAEFFARVVLAVRAGAPISEALVAVRTSKTWQALPGSWLVAAQASASSSETDSVALKNHGLNCHTDHAFPCICHLLLRYPTDPVSALIENSTAGGDSAARGMILGLVYGAKFTTSTLPAEWLSGLKAHSEIIDLIHQFKGI